MTRQAKKTERAKLMNDKVHEAIIDYCEECIDNHMLFRMKDVLVATGFEMMAASIKWWFVVEEVEARQQAKSKDYALVPLKAVYFTMEAKHLIALAKQGKGLSMEDVNRTVAENRKRPDGKKHPTHIASLVAGRGPGETAAYADPGIHGGIFALYRYEHLRSAAQGQIDSLKKLEDGSTKAIGDLTKPAAPVITFSTPTGGEA